MAWMQEIDLQEAGVTLPTGGHWVDVPGSPFQVMAALTDIMGVVHIRINPVYAHHWNEFMSFKETEGEI